MLINVLLHHLQKFLRIIIVLIKLQFIPNPVDSSIENLKNYRDNTLDIDIFSAISHGQNRGCT